MYKTLVLDQYDMLSVGELDFDVFTKTAAFYKEAKTTKEDLSRQLDTDFAAVLVIPTGDKIRKFPINSKANTDMSLKAFEKNYKKMPDTLAAFIGHRLFLAAERFDIKIPDSVNGIYKNYPTSDRNAYYLVDETTMSFFGEEDYTEKDAAYWGVSAKTAAGDIFKFPIKTAMDVKKYVTHFDKYAGRLCTKYAFDFARNLEKRARYLEVEIPEDSTINLYCNATVSPVFRHAIDARIKEASDMETKMEYLSLLKEAATATPHQLAIKLENIDRDNRMNIKYGQGIMDPITSTMAIVKQAEVIDAATASMETSDVAKSIKKNRDLFVEHLGEKLTAELERDGTQKIKALPVPVRQLILELINQIG